MTTPTKVSFGVTDTISVPIDSPARRVAAELARLDIRIMIRFGDDNVGNLRDLALLDEDFAADVLQKIIAAVNKEEG